MKIGIALAIFNPNLDFLSDQLKSLIHQSHLDWECVLSDESTDPIVSRQAEQLSGLDPRFRWVRRQELPRGPAANFEYALNQLSASCEVFAFCDQDDIWEPQKLERLLELLEKKPAAPLVHSDLSLIDGKGQMIATSCWQMEKRNFAHNSSLLELVLRNRVTGCTMIFRKDLLNLALPFPKEVHGAYLHDHWVASLGLILGPAVDCGEPLVQYRQHGGNVVGASDLGWWPSLARIFRAAIFFKTKADAAFRVRYKLAKDLRDRIQERKPESLHFVEVELETFLKPRRLLFFRGLRGAKFMTQEFLIWLLLNLSFHDLSVGSAIDSASVDDQFGTL